MSHRSNRQRPIGMGLNEMDPVAAAQLEQVRREQFKAGVIQFINDSTAKNYAALLASTRCELTPQVFAQLAEAAHVAARHLAQHLGMITIADDTAKKES